MKVDIISAPGVLARTGLRWRKYHLTPNHMPNAIVAKLAKTMAAVSQARPYRRTGWYGTGTHDVLPYRRTRTVPYCRILQLISSTYSSNIRCFLLSFYFVATNACTHDIITGN